MTYKVAIAGATGYAGGEVLRLLLNHPAYASSDLEIGALTGHSNAGQSVAELMPHLPQLADRTIVDTTVENLEGHDVVFLGLPHGHSGPIAKALGEDAVVIDCAADFRLKDAQDWEDFYGSEHAGTWPYGIPELPGNREQLKGSKRVAVPGCFPTTMTLGALPAIHSQIIEPDLTIIAVTGVSGAGKKASVPLIGAETMGSVKAYSPGGTHRHTPEVIQNLTPFAEKTVNVSFTPVLAPMPRGILATITAPLKEGVTQEQVTKIFNEFYAEEPFCHVLPQGQQPQTQYVVGSNMCHIQAHVDERAGKLIITSALDNLTKGTAGAAVQCMNLSLGIDEAAGLPQAAVAP
ncbi:N-acetyl-gamma-glutamyl-phosphate reductase [Corynebacterium casei]|uniref:N-acetyl-gamma-glutamyl-phosphate reductase n=1 Tax=Corynebacterium casei TaxID=160386 RepID=UPI003FD01FC5